MWGRAGRAGAGTKKSQVGEMWLRSTLSRVPERPPSTPGIHSLTQQLLLSTFSVAGTLIGPGSIAMKNQTQILPQGAYNLGVSIQWLQVFFLGHLEFSVRGPLRISVHKHTAHTHGHKWLISAHAYTRSSALTRTRPAPLCSPPSHAHAGTRTDNVYTHALAPTPLQSPSHAECQRAGTCGVTDSSRPEPRGRSRGPCGGSARGRC